MDPHTVHVHKLIRHHDTRNITHLSSSEHHRDHKPSSSLHHNLDASSQSKPSNHDYRLHSDRKENFPNGYLEDWSSGSLESSSYEIKHNSINDSNAKSTRKISPKEPTKPTRKLPKHSHKLSKESTKHSHKLPKDSRKLPLVSTNKSLPYTSLKDETPSTLSLDSNFSLHLSENGLTDLMKSSDMSMPQHQHQYPIPAPISVKYNPVSIILCTESNILLNKDTTHNIRFSTGMLEGSGISIDNSGNEISFQDEGSYRFEICGEATPFSDVDVKLVYYSSSFSDDVRPFSEITVPKDEGKLLLRGLATILPIQKGQKVSPRLIPVPDESIVLMNNTRLIIHRVA